MPSWMFWIAIHADHLRLGRPALCAVARPSQARIAHLADNLAGKWQLGVPVLEIASESCRERGKLSIG